MTSTDDRKVQWRVQVRKNRAHKWVNKGLYETRDVARFAAACMRSLHYVGDDIEAQAGYGFGNTRVKRYVRGDHG